MEASELWLWFWGRFWYIPLEYWAQVDKYSYNTSSWNSDWSLIWRCKKLVWVDFNYIGLPSWTKIEWTPLVLGLVVKEFALFRRRLSNLVAEDYQQNSPQNLEIGSYGWFDRNFVIFDHGNMEGESTTINIWYIDPSLFLLDPGPTRQ